ncbi:hypothetical protein QUC31_017188 [Theobroma cacao]
MKKQESVFQTHVLVMPLPVQGHINPMLQFSKRLGSEGLEVTLCTFSGNKSMPVQVGPVKLEPVSDDLQLDNDLKTVDAYLERFKAVATLRLPEIIAKRGISYLVYDSAIPWALDIAKHLGLPAAAFFTQSCAVDTIYYNVHEGLVKLPLAESSLSIDGLPLLQECDLPSFVYDIGSYPALLHTCVNQFSNFMEADWVFINTFTSLEDEVGIRARKDDKGIITKEEIQRCIREIMEGDKSKDIKKNAEKWKNLAVEAVNVGGSSEKNIREFVAKLTCN